MGSRIRQPGLAIQVLATSAKRPSFVARHPRKYPFSRCRLRNGLGMGEAATRVAAKGLFCGVDLSEKMIEKATENFAGRGSLHFIKANVESIPLDGNFFDIVISTNSFHHYLHPDRALTEMQRLLKPEGRMYILDPTADHWIVTVADKIIRFFEREHVKMYSTIEFRAMFEKAGLHYLGSENVITREKVHIAQKLSDKILPQT